MSFSFPGLKRGKDGTKSLNKLLPNTGTPVIAVNSQGILTIAEPVTATDTMIIGDVTYTFMADGTAVAAGDIDLRADEAATKLAIVAAINGTDSLNSPNPLVSASAFDSDVCTLTARSHGTDGNAIVTTQEITHASNIFDATTLGTTTAGVDGTIGVAGEQKIDDSYLYICMNDGSGLIPSSWRRISLGSAY